ncbi:putative nuclease HARBI1 [Astyanax mexicanus]|uniref:Putative nuclease HARBI1 n=1 Tax=Astyanax mexicanus TaxID=7994 RepID=A0A8T2MHD7_ASTMX|nr:putative nuclease HARBI1 [Astyanax mexicanus]
MAALQRIIELNRQRRRRSEVVYMNAFIRTTFNPLEVLSDEAIIRKYRLSRAAIEELLHFVHPHLLRATRRNYALSPTVQFLAALRYYASGSTQVLGDGLGLSKSSVSRAVTAVTQTLLQLNERMTFPSSAEDIARVNHSFHAIANFPQVIGVIDGTLIQIARPSLNEPAYFSRKGYPALNVQVVCDSQGVFTDIVAKWPGSTHDSFIWANSALCQVAEGGGFKGSWLLGDSGYPLRPYLLTPIQQARTEAEERYNSAHTQTRAVVERAIGLWKQRFRCLSRSAGGLQLHPTKCCAVVVVTALLHNTALKANVQLPEDEYMPVEDAEDAVFDHLQPGNPAGQQIRQQLVENMFGL